MLTELTQEEKDVIEEMITCVRNDRGFYSAGDVEKELFFDFRHGQGESLKLLNRALPHLQSVYGLTGEEFDSLKHKARYVAKYEIWHWSYQEEKPEVNPDLIVVDGEAYMILDGGIRIDYGPDYYFHIREDFAKTGVYDEGLN